MKNDASFVYNEKTVRDFVKSCVPSRLEYNKLTSSYCKKFSPDDPGMSYKVWIDTLVRIAIEKKWSQDEIRYVINACVNLLKNGREND